MTVSVRDHAAGYPIYVVSAGDSVFELSSFGGQLLSWVKAGVPILFSNEEHAVQDGKTAYRGGAPICFPYFGKGNLLPSEPITPQHGRARTSIWEGELQESAIVLRTDQPSPDGFGPTTLVCELTYRFGEGVAIEGAIQNAGENASPFQLAVHSYWACETPAKATVSGLGERYLDNLAGLHEAHDDASASGHEAPVDRVYPDSAETLRVSADRYVLSISTSGCSGTVLWNPGAEHGLKDLGKPDFICVESGVISSPPTLAAGNEYRFSIDYKLTH